MAAAAVGAAIRRREDARFLTGSGTFTDDINRPGQAYMAIVRSSHAHARIRKIDAAKTAKATGVLAVFTGADLEKDGVPVLEDQRDAVAEMDTPVLLDLDDALAEPVARSNSPIAARGSMALGASRLLVRSILVTCAALANAASTAALSPISQS